MSEMKWISVKDKLPKKNTAVLVSSQFSLYIAWISYISIDGKEICWTCSVSDLIPHDLPLYWMPLDFLPPLPEE